MYVSRQNDPVLNDRLTQSLPDIQLTSQLKRWKISFSYRFHRPPFYRQRHSLIVQSHFVESGHALAEKFQHRILGLPDCRADSWAREEIQQLEQQNQEGAVLSGADTRS